jgi:hypothetical protein
MTTSWTKLGLLFCLPPGGLHTKLASHTANPVPIHISDDLYRIFYSSRDLDNRSSVGAVDVDIVRRTVVHVHTHPFFEYGPFGSFYADGVSIGNVYEADGTRYLLFMGWQNKAGEHWRGDIGRLIINPDLTLSIDSCSPFMQSDDIDPISLSYPWVFRRSDGAYEMWYGSTTTWETSNGEMLHVLKHATSRNGHSFHKTGVEIPHQLGKAQAFSRPTIIGSDELGYEMWFSYRSGTGTTYRIGRAMSCDGKDWSLSLESGGLVVSNEGWDSEMVEYPYVFEHKGIRYMLYNGNGYGKSGFGIAQAVGEVRPLK